MTPTEGSCSTAFQTGGGAPLPHFPAVGGPAVAALPASASSTSQSSLPPADAAGPPSSRFPLGGRDQPLQRPRSANTSPMAERGRVQPCEQSGEQSCSSNGGEAAAGNPETVPFSCAPRTESGSALPTGPGRPGSAAPCRYGSHPSKAILACEVDVLAVPEPAGALQEAAPPLASGAAPTTHPTASSLKLSWQGESTGTRPHGRDTHLLSRVPREPASRASSVTVHQLILPAESSPPDSCSDTTEQQVLSRQPSRSRPASPILVFPTLSSTPADYSTRWMVNHTRSPGRWADMPEDILSSIIRMLHTEGQRRLRATCKPWLQAHQRCFLNLSPRILVPDILASCFSLTRALDLANTIPGHGFPQFTATQSLAPLACMRSLKQVDLSTSPGRLFFGLGIKTTAQDILALSTLPNLRSLNLSGQCYGASWGLEVLRTFTGLTDLNVSGECPLTCADLRALSDLTQLACLNLGERRFEGQACLAQLHSLQRLQVLGLSKCYFADSAALQLMSLAALPELASLDISCWCSVNDAVMVALPTITTLTHLNISSTQVADEALAVLMAMPWLCYLDASYCMEVRGDCLSGPLATANLTALDLCECRKAVVGRLRHIQAAGRALQPQDLVSSDVQSVMAGLPSLALSSRPGLSAISMHGCHHLSILNLHRLVEHTALERLALPYPLPYHPSAISTTVNDLGFLTELRGLRALHIDGIVDSGTLGPEVLTALQYLESLRIQQCISPGPYLALGLLSSLRKLTIDSCSTFCAATLRILLSCESLKELQLNTAGDAWPHLTNEVIRSLQPALSRLQKLKLGSCTNVDDRGAELLAESCTNLTHLTMRALPKLTDAGITPLASIPYLAHLDLACCQQLGNGACEAAAACHSLVSLDLSGCAAVGEAGIRALAGSVSLRRASLRGCCGASSGAMKLLPKW
eukprot:CAMPEP_0117665774 /NCGR_PEP_ID=MMETSP0804-20121206/10000_1 /TAXON_ID=1074897 /ORGANISM="Tetraselmis astigmatica, Strain CCMP880" /LENGTH=926 /DNA_ID=CAMNT_0005473231 /DNA_START=80 /DNA_END=2857 /DNA_ORIENTATION=-